MHDRIRLYFNITLLLTPFWWFPPSDTFPQTPFLSFPGFGYLNRFSFFYPRLKKTATIALINQFNRIENGKIKTTFVALYPCGF